MKKNLSFVLFSVLFILFTGCNAISLQNTSNDFKWKNKKFNTTFDLQLDYNPQIVDKISSNYPVFFRLSETDSLDVYYRIKETLEQKFDKRNIRFVEKSNVILTIDKLIFEEYVIGKTVVSNDGDKDLGDSDQDVFRFKIIGTVKSNGEAKTIYATKRHKTKPRESYTLSGVIVKDGVNAKTEIMIENTLNEFSYRVYKKLK